MFGVFYLRKGRARFSAALPALLFLLVATLAPPPALAQPREHEHRDIVEEIVVTGTRRVNRTVADSLSPIDVLTDEALKNQGAVELTDLLRSAVPSWQVDNHPVDDHAALVRPAKLRGQSADQTLVLVNSKRRHRSAVIAFSSDDLTAGSQGPDLSVIPAIALERVEVLRDGAAAQYGSDAIAGVLNFILKDDPTGGALLLNFGERYEGDGQTQRLAANIGLPLGRRGFLNLSADIFEQSETDRSTLPTGLGELIEKFESVGQSTAGLPDATPIWGKPEIRDAFHFFANAGFALNDDTELYAFGSYATRETQGDLFFRNPDSGGGVFVEGEGGDDGHGHGEIDSPSEGDDDEETHRLVGALTQAAFDSDACHAFEELSPAAHEDGAAAAAAREDARQLAALAADPNCFAWNELYPNGFTPRLGGELSDASLTLGLRGELASGLRYDLSVGHAENEIEFRIANTVNAARGPEQPPGARFRPGAYIQQETNLQANFSNSFNFSNPFNLSNSLPELHLAVGVEWREERFETRAGDPFSWTAADPADQSPIEQLLLQQGFSPASNGFAGFTPEQAGEWSRASTSLYVDIETDLVPRRMTVGLAGRFENYADFGSSAEGKLAARYELSEALGLRGTVSTGFRAPTPGQANVRNLSTRFDLTGSRRLVESGLVPPTDPIARRHGGVVLEPEQSTNYTFGLNWAAPRGLVLTVDFFRIEIDDRLAPSAPFDVTPEDEAEAQRLGLPGVRVGSELRYYTNSWDTETSGVELVGDFEWDFGAAGVTDFTLAASYVATEVAARDPEIIDERRRFNVENLLPKTRAVLTANHYWRDWRITGRASYWGSWRTVGAASDDACAPGSGLHNCPTEILRFGSELLFDLEVAYRFDAGVTLVAGAQNIFDTYPDRYLAGQSTGQLYHEHAPFGFSGGYWYTRLEYNF